jgi:predicted ribosome quality control (RQC) complex YloA/Tae2 family protein
VAFSSASRIGAEKVHGDGDGYDGLVGRDKRPPKPSDPDAGVWQGRSVARVAESPDGMIVLVGRTARDNDVLSLKLASPGDFWFHVAGESGSHVVVRNPDGLDSLPRDTKRFAASLSAGYSKARRGGTVAVHMARAGDVTKSRGLPPGKVHLRRFTTVYARPIRIDEEEDS